jgi:hypothetical protein
MRVTMTVRKLNGVGAQFSIWPCSSSKKPQSNRSITRLSVDCSHKCLSVDCSYIRSNVMGSICVDGLYSRIGFAFPSCRIDFEAVPLQKDLLQMKLRPSAKPITSQKIDQTIVSLNKISPKSSFDLGGGMMGQWLRPPWVASRSQRDGVHDGENNFQSDGCWRRRNTHIAGVFSRRRSASSRRWMPTTMALLP